MGCLQCFSCCCEDAEEEDIPIVLILPQLIIPQYSVAKRKKISCVHHREYIHRVLLLVYMNELA